MHHTLLKNIQILGFLFIGAIIYGQEYQFDIQNTSLDAYIQMEEQLGSVQMPNTTKYISLSGNAQPITFKRKGNILPGLVTYLHFKEKDSLMSKVLYEWDPKNSKELEEGEKQSEEFQKALIQKYKDLEKELTTLYGTPKSRGNLSDTTLADQPGGLRKNNKWYPNEHTEIELYIVVSNMYKKSGIVTITPTYRIRLYIKNR
ncbi:hypothetical protein GCM10011344_04770 [Dokdonia pacifica]|uniref:Uncharacterized protein n=1 Tax=Dokdonia pacifica TaxID=1627892 RepID=A0A238ZNJ7_9FLAO|nr:hypothetical protein [Dokdonia pacifica]GGG07303.1 hypothetical protein GCM10011344_04770 [Dokdonia pacifica]SNR84284.1 hypothetical protein SAMN06265376_103338 [Dokdonia pacifica]